MRGKDYRGRRVLVLGLARSGLAATEFLLGKGAWVRAADLKPEQELSKDLTELKERGVELALGSPHRSGLADDVDLVVVSPGVHPETGPLKEARARKIPVWGELELAFREIEGPVVAVTGTKGKSTTATLIAEILMRGGRSVALGGNIGQPLIGLVEQAHRDSLFVVEVSSFQLEAIEEFRPRVAVLLNVTPDHLDWHPSFEEYRKAKERVFANQGEDDWAVVYGANRLTRDMATKGRSKKVYFSLDCIGDREPHWCVQDGWIVKHEDAFIDEWIPLESVPIRGQHNVENVMAAAATTSVLGVERDVTTEAVTGFPGVPHALERVAEISGVAFYNDSKATNVAAARAAIASFERGVILVLGGRSKGADFAGLRDEVKSKVKAVLAMGESREEIARALGGLVPVVMCGELREVVERAFAMSQPGDTVLLSPACASFDMFSDYAERGQRFRAEVERLKKTLPGNQRNKSSKR
jgi:UDP-N-acetylmuramoylalanine--D-glutamate ligase